MKNKGITLIALIVTIIILLILAGISISALIGENGILTKATTVDREFSKGEVQENLAMLINERLINAYKLVGENGNVEDISTYFNEGNLINYLEGNSDDNDTEYMYHLDNINNVETIYGVLGETVYTIYYLNASTISPEVKRIGKGDPEEALKDIFTLEVIKDENDSSKSSGSYNVIYYDTKGNAETLVTIELYKTNNS